MDIYEQQMLEDYERAINQNKQQSSFGVICPHSFDTKTNKNTCVLCSLCKEVLFDRSSPKNSPLKEKARSLNAKKRYYSNVIFLTNPSEVVVLEYGEKIFNKLIVGQFDALSEWKNFMHPTQGRNIYITKIKVGPEKKDVDYNVEPRMSISSIPDKSVLTKLYDINEIPALIESGKVQPVYQSKFDFVKTEVRFLPSGDSAHPFLFYKSLLWHYNISKEDFVAVQEGRYNPITNTWKTPAADNSREWIRPSGNISIHEPYQNPIPEITPKPATSHSPINIQPVRNEDDDLPSWVLEEDTNADTLTSTPETENNTLEPICFSQYDSNSPICTGKCIEAGWAESCKKLYDEKLALRAKARKLSR